MNDDDDALVSRLRDIAAVIDPVPGIVTQAGYAALSTMRLDEELAELVMDSDLVDASHLRAVGERTRVLSFATATVSVELQMKYELDQLELRGFVSEACDVAIETADAATVVPVDDEGWFHVTGIRPGPLRIRLITAGLVALTPWFHP